MKDDPEKPILIPYLAEPQVIKPLVLAARIIAAQAENVPDPDQHLSIEYEVALALEQANNFSEVIPRIIEVICKLLDWDFGAFWLVVQQEQVLRCDGIWLSSSAPVNQGEFAAATTNIRFEPGQGLPGRVWSTGQTIWIPDITNTDTTNLPRAPYALKEGLKAALGFPLFFDNQILGVLEFFSRTIKEPNQDLLAMLTVVGSQIGQVLERQRTIDNLRESELRFRSIFESSNDAIIVADGAGNITNWNLGAQTIFGYNKHEIIGQPLTLLMSENYKSAHLQGMARFKKSGEAHVIGKTVELTGLRKDGIEFPLELSLSAWETAEGFFFSGVIRDITERKRAEEERAELSRAQEAIIIRDEFLSIASHELKTPVTNILGYSQMLQRQMEKPGSTDQARIREGIEIIGQQSKKLAHLISQLLDTSRLEASKMVLQLKETDLSGLVKEVINAIQMRYNRQTITLTAPAQLQVVIDPIRIEQVLVNLLDNAMKYSPPESPIEVEIVFQAGQGTIRLAVKNQGVGISAEDRTRIFDRFFQAHTKSNIYAGGMGLGLYISRQIVELHYGRLEVDSWSEEEKETMTTCLVMTLPANLLAV